MNHRAPISKAKTPLPLLNPQWISRSGLASLFVIQIFVIAPHFFYVPYWVAGIWIFCAFWRWQVFQGAWTFPNGLVKTLLVAVTSAALLLSFGVNFSFQTMVSLLIVGFSLKLIEMKSPRDYLWVIFIGLFIIASQFIEFSQIVSAIYGGLCLSLLCVAFMQLEPNSKTFFQQWKKSSVILLQSIPIMLIFFVVSPRMGAFWSVPSAQHAKTGMSDSMSPGDFSNLMQSNELVFRVKFDGQMPANRDLYWRSLVFSQFDGHKWFAGDALQRNIKKSPYSDSSGLIKFWGAISTYEIIAEPSNATWLYTLAAPQSWSSQIIYQPEMRLAVHAPINQLMRYKVTSQLNYQFNAAAEEIKFNQQLPDDFNPRTKNFVRRLQLEATTTEELIQKIFEFYHREFYYTLRPPALGQNNIDDFLFETHQGFCEHFASSFVFMLRAAGIPARVVVGYQGGSLNSVDGVLSVRQRDAHAWAEVWMGEPSADNERDINHKKGWVMFDPTAAVAPERIERGIDSALNTEDQTYLARSLGSSIKLLNWTRAQIEALNFQWTHWVLNYDSSLQSQFLSRWFNNLSPLSIVLWLLFVIGSILAIILCWLLLQSKTKSRSELEIFYQSLCTMFKPFGFNPEQGEAPGNFFLRIGKRHPQLQEPALHLAQAFNEFAFAEQSITKTSTTKTSTTKTSATKTSAKKTLVIKAAAALRGRIKLLIAR